MKKVLLVMIALGAGGWWYFVGGRTLSEAHVHEFYAKSADALFRRQPELMCDLLDDRLEYRSVSSVAGMVEPQEATYNKAQACAHYVELVDTIKKLGDRMGGVLQIDYNYTVDSIQLSRDKKTATVEYSYDMRLGGRIMRVQGSSTDTLVRNNGKTRVLRSQSEDTTYLGGT